MLCRRRPESTVAALVDDDRERDKPDSRKDPARDAVQVDGGGAERRAFDMESKPAPDGWTGIVARRGSYQVSGGLMAAASGSARHGRHREGPQQRRGRAQRHGGLGFVGRRSKKSVSDSDDRNAKRDEQSAR